MCVRILNLNYFFFDPVFTQFIPDIYYIKIKDRLWKFYVIEIWMITMLFCEWPDTIWSKDISHYDWNWMKIISSTRRVDDNWLFALLNKSCAVFGGIIHKMAYLIPPLDIENLLKFFETIVAMVSVTLGSNSFICSASVCWCLILLYILHSHKHGAQHNVS